MNRNTGNKLFDRCLWCKWLLFIALTVFQGVGRTVCAGTISGSVDLGYQQNRLQAEGKADTRTTTVSQRYNLDYEDSIYRSWLGSYKIGTSFANTSMSRTGEETDTTLSSYRINGKLLPLSPFPTTWYYINNDTHINTLQGDDSQLDTRAYGVDLSLDFKQLPTTKIFHYGQDSQSTLGSADTLQASRTTGISMDKRWDSLTANLRLEQSGYEELTNNAWADADRLSTSLTYRPSADLQLSMLVSDYNRSGDNPSLPEVDPLYSDRQTSSRNVSLLWNMSQQTNLALRGNYFLENIETSERDAVDGHAAINHRFNDYLSGTISTYSIETLLNQEQFTSLDNRIGFNYSRPFKRNNWEIQGSAGVGYFTRETSTQTQPFMLDEGFYYQLTTNLSRPFRSPGFVITPYVNFSYGRGKQTSASESTYLNKEVGTHADGRFAAGRLSGNLSYQTYQQENDLRVYSEQLRAFIDYSRRVGRRANLRAQSGYTRTSGELTDELYGNFTRDPEDWLDTYYMRFEYTTPLLSSGMLWKTSLRADFRQDTQNSVRDTVFLDTRMSQHIGKLFYEFGYYRKNNNLDGIRSTESAVFVNVKRNLNARF